MLSALALVSILTGSAGWSGPAGAEGQGTAFRQAVAEAAAQDPEVAAYYRDTAYQPIWTGDGEADHARRQALVQALSQAALHGLPEPATISTG